jgi:hypothetical protein
LAAAIYRLFAQQFLDQHQAQGERGTRQQAQPGFELRGWGFLSLEAFAAINTAFQGAHTITSQSMSTQ